MGRKRQHTHEEIETYSSLSKEQKMKLEPLLKKKLV